MKAYSWFLLLFTLIACSPKTDSPDPQPSEILSEEMVAQIDLSPGVRNDRLQLPNGTWWNFRISVPQHDSTDSLPIIIALHWAGADDTYLEYASCLVEPAFMEKKFILFSPADQGVHWAADYNQLLLEKFIQSVNTHWPVDPGRVVVTGYSNGGIGSWAFAINFPDLISAAIPMAGSYNSDQLIEVPMYLVHGALDDLFPFNTIEPQIQSAIAKGSKITFVKAEGLSHFQACSYVEHLKNGIAWLETEVW